MQTLLRCKSCGYVVAEEALKGEVCPACGVPRKMFEPYTDRVGEKRRRFLALDLHPIVAHFPVSFITLLLALCVSPYIFYGEAEQLLIATAKVMALLTPVAGLAAIIAGLMDGTTRFRKVTRSPILRRKIRLAVAFVVVSLALAAALWLGRANSDLFIVLSAAAAAVGLVCAFLLGRLGGKVRDSAFPGD